MHAINFMQQTRCCFMQTATYWWDRVSRWGVCRRWQLEPIHLQSPTAFCRPPTWIDARACWRHCSDDAPRPTDRCQVTSNCCSCHVSAWARIRNGWQPADSVPVGGRITGVTQQTGATDRPTDVEDAGRTPMRKLATTSPETMLMSCCCLCNWWLSATQQRRGDVNDSTHLPHCSARRLGTWDPPTRKTHLRPRRSTPNTVLMDPPVGRCADATSRSSARPGEREGVAFRPPRPSAAAVGNSRLAEDVQMAPCAGDADVI